MDSTPPSSASVNRRVSPYPLRVRTPSTTPSPAPPSRQTAPRSGRQGRVSLDESPQTRAEHRLQILVQPIVKSTIGQRDSSAKRLEDFVANGDTFTAIMNKLWNQFSSQIKGVATKTDDVWSMGRATELEWSRVMQFKWNRHVVPCSKTEQAWDRWVASLRGETVTLMIYEYGLGIPNASIYDEFVKACIRPEYTDRAGATAEASLREIVTSLRDVWGNTYQASAVVWRMWANEITRNLNRSTWETAIMDPPVDRVERLLRPAGTPVDQHLEGLTRTARLALDVISASVADNKQVQGKVEALFRLLESQARALQARKEAVEGFLEDIPLPPLTDGVDQLASVVNVPDTDHQG